MKIINFFVKILLKNLTKKSVQFSNQQIEEELKGAIDLYGKSDSDSKQEKVMLQNVLTLSDTSVDEIMTHRSNIFSINQNYILERLSFFLGFDLFPDSVFVQLHQDENQGIFNFRKNESKSIKLEGIKNVMANFGKCCNPIPGDSMVGFITRGRGMTVHRVNCYN